MNRKFRKGNYVRHKNLSINAAVPMSIEDITEKQVKCSHFTSHKGEMKTEWFDKTDLELVVYGENKQA